MLDRADFPNYTATDAELIANIEARYPDLDIGGFPADFRDGSEPKLSQALQQGRDCGFAVALAFIKAGAPGGWRHPEGYYSYGLKHAAERWSERTYVSNGAMIAAAIACGWSVRRIGINAYLSPPGQEEARSHTGKQRNRGGRSAR